MRRLIIRLLAAAALALALGGCSPLTAPPSILYSSGPLDSGGVFSQNVVGLQDDSLGRLFDSISCRDFESRIWNHIYVTLFDESPPPPPAAVKKKIKSYAQSYLSRRSASPLQVRNFTRHFVNIYSKTFEFFANKTEEMILEELALIDLMVGVSFSTGLDNPSVILFLNEVKGDFKALKKITHSLSLSCVNLYPDHVVIRRNLNIPFLSSMRSSLHPLVYGARKVMATAYQDCRVLDLPLLSSRAKPVQGIIKTSYHKGGGLRRSISSLSSVNRSHYYLRKTKTSSSRQCIDVSRNPLIYDFGGKPAVSSYPHYQMNLFKNSGSGSKALGVDCSGFVMASLAAAGLRVQKGRSLKPAQISGISSWMLASPSNNLNCLKKIHLNHHSSEGFIQAGDILASKGHVVIVDQVGGDPLALAKRRSVKDCKKENISAQDFHFSIIHSSPALGGIGINRVHIRNADQPLLIKGLIQLASNICYKKFGYKTPRTSPGLSVSRPTLSSSCRGGEIPLKGEECLASCWRNSSI